jgi:hypothetical protein
MIVGLLRQVISKVDLKFSSASYSFGNKKKIPTSSVTHAIYETTPAPEAGALPGCATSRGGFFVAPAWRMCQVETDTENRRAEGDGRGMWQGIAGTDGVECVDSSGVLKSFFRGSAWQGMAEMDRRGTLGCT